MSYGERTCTPFSVEDEAILADLLSLIGDTLYLSEDPIAKARSILVLLGENPDVATQDITDEIILDLQLREHGASDSQLASLDSVFDPSHDCGP